MIQIVGLKRENLIMTRGSENFTNQDMEKILPLLQKVKDDKKKVRWYFEMHDFIDSSLIGFWENVKFDSQFFNNYDKIAIVGEKRWQNWIFQFIKEFNSEETKYFDLSEGEAAKKWINH